MTPRQMLIMSSFVALTVACFKYLKVGTAHHLPSSHFIQNQLCRVTNHSANLHNYCPAYNSIYNYSYNFEMLVWGAYNYS